MSTQYVSSTFEQKLIRTRSDGVIDLNTTTIYPGKSPVESGKTSVDSGSFTPGEYRVNPYTVYHTEQRCGVSPMEKKFVSYGKTYEYTLTGNYMINATHLYYNTGVPSTLSKLANEALQKAYGNVAKANLGIGEDLGEIRETLNMLRHPLKDLREFLTANNKRNLRRLLDLRSYLKTSTFDGMSGKAAAKAAANTWLELRYGFRPLVHSIGDIVEEVRRKERKAWDPNKIRCARSHASTSDTGSYPMQATIGSFDLQFQGTVVDVMTGYASVQYRQDKPNGTLADLGLTPSFWPETAWELTRLSFVMDWFVTIGPWLQSLRIKPSVTVLGHTTGQRLSRETTVKPVLLQYGRTWKSVEGPVGHFIFEYYHRDVGIGSPWLPKLRVGDVIDISKLVDLLALALQRLFK